MGKREDDWKKNGSPFEREIATKRGMSVQALREQSRETAKQNGWGGWAKKK